MFSDPSMVVIPSAIKAFVTDQSAFGSGGIIAVDLATGRQTKIAAATQFIQPFGIACQSDGQLVVAYMAGSPSTVARVDPTNGDHRLVAPDVEFFMPVGVALDSADNVIVVEGSLGDLDSLLHRIDHGVGHSILADNVPAGALYNSVAFDRGGNILVGCNRVHADPQLVRFHPITGAPTIVSQGLHLGEPLGIAVEVTGSILVANAGTGIVRLDPATGAHTMACTGGSFAFTCGVALVP
jgi:streptogramin lyase